MQWAVTVRKALSWVLQQPRPFFGVVNRVLKRAGNAVFLWRFLTPFFGWYFGVYLGNEVVRLCWTF